MAEQQETINGAIITYFSTASAVGKTLVSINSAAELAREGYRVCLVDFDLQFGDVCNYLQLLPESTVADVQQGIATSGADCHVDDYLTPYVHEAATFYVMASPLKLEEAYNIKTAPMKAMLTQLQTLFDYVVVDTTSMFSEMNLAVLDLSTVVIFLGIRDFFPTIKNMSIGNETLKNLHYDQNKLRIVLNRGDSQSDIPMGLMVKTLGGEFYHILPNDFRVANESIKSGVPLVLSHEETKLGQSLRELVYRSTNQDYAPEDESVAEHEMHGGFLSRLFGGRE